MNEAQKIAYQTETTQEPGSHILAMFDVMLVMRFSDDITISPDGKLVAFVVWERVPDEPKRRERILSADTTGGDDPAVPVAQAHAFYRALRERNVPVELVVYPREGHGLNERAHQRDALERHLRWLERYLCGTT